MMHHGSSRKTNEGSLVPAETPEIGTFAGSVVVVVVRGCSILFYCIVCRGSHQIRSSSAAVNCPTVVIGYSKSPTKISRRGNLVQRPSLPGGSVGRAPQQRIQTFGNST